MIEEQETLVGELNNPLQYIKPDLQEKTVIPSKNEQNIIPDENFNGLSNVCMM